MVQSGSIRSHNLCVARGSLGVQFCALISYCRGAMETVLYGALLVVTLITWPSVTGHTFSDPGCVDGKPCGVYGTCRNDSCVCGYQQRLSHFPRDVCSSEHPGFYNAFDYPSCDTTKCPSHAGSCTSNGRKCRCADGYLVWGTFCYTSRFSTQPDHCNNTNCDPSWGYCTGDTCRCLRGRIAVDKQCVKIGCDEGFVERPDQPRKCLPTSDQTTSSQPCNDASSRCTRGSCKSADGSGDAGSFRCYCWWAGASGAQRCPYYVWGTHYLASHHHHN